jgi:HlyD family secretion protein/adhesin transport system membrane fusion protein
VKATRNNDEKYESVGERQRLALPIELEEGAPPALARTGMAVLSGLIIALFIWANIASVRELSVAVGEIVPFGSTRAAAHLEGGIVEDVLASTGDAVLEGDPLIRLRAESAGGELDQFEARRASLELRSARLAAQAEGGEPEFGRFLEAWPAIANEQRRVHQVAVEQHRAVMATFKERETSAEAEVLKAEAEFSAETELLELAQQQLEIQEQLITERFTSKQSYLQAKAAVASAKAAAAGARSRLDQARGALAAAREDGKGAAAEYQTRIAEEQAAVVAELAELREPLASLQDRSDRLTVRAPVAGVVNDLLVKGKGDVVPPGGVVAEITPTGAELMAEVRVSPQDIGHISVGMDTEVSITAFDPNRYGKVKGAVAHISADTFTDERTGDAYYIAYISFSSQEIGAGDRARALAPGMQVRAEIITQSRTLMQYLLKPVSRSLDQAFTER